MKFSEIKSNFKNKYTSIRDVYYDEKLSKVFLLGMEKINDDCKKIKFDSYKIKYLENTAGTLLPSIGIQFEF